MTIDLDAAHQRDTPGDVGEDAPAVDVARYRHVHLDFHTAGNIPLVADRFDADAFAEVFASSNVDSVNVFAKCHHGYSYYSTEVGTMHPGLSLDLLGHQIQALHARGIKAPIYISVLWDDLAGEKHPEWVVTTRTGSLLMRAPLSNDSPNQGQVGWTTMDVSSGYGDYVAAQVSELCEKYDVDGFWFDIVWPEPNYSPSSQARLRKAGVSLEDENAVHAYSVERLREFMERISGIVRERAPGATVFFNGSVNARVGGTLAYQSHLEVESLPTSGADWGYMHYPVMSRFARTFGVPMIGMTGRFQKSWADFGGLKTANQLLYEAGTILSGGGRISIGDQLDPSGRLDPAVYRTVGAVYERVRDLEPWLRDTTPLAEVAILGAEAPAQIGEVASNQFAKLAPEVEGIAQVLLECSIQFDIVDPARVTRGDYRALIIPDGYLPRPSEISLIEEARRGGMKVVLSGTACLDEHSRFVLRNVPVAYRGVAPTVPTYLRFQEYDEAGSGIADDYDYVFYDTAHLVDAASDSVQVGVIKRARYDRTWEHFTSHAHAPVGDSLESPVAVMSHDVLYLAAPLFGGYGNHEYWVYRAAVRQLLRQFIGEPRLQFDGPAWIEVSVHSQEAREGSTREVVHLTAFQSRRTGHPIPRVDEGGAIVGTTMSLRVDRLVQTVYVAPTLESLEFTQSGGVLEVTLPAINTHLVVVIE